MQNIKSCAAYCENLENHWWNASHIQRKFVIHFKPYIILYTVGPHDIAIIYDVILQTAVQWLKLNINQHLNFQNTHHASLLWASYGVSTVRVWKKIDTIILAPHSILDHVMMGIRLYCDLSINYHDVFFSWWNLSYQRTTRYRGSSPPCLWCYSW